MHHIALRPLPSRYRLWRYTRRKDYCWITRLDSSRLASTLKTGPSPHAAVPITLSPGPPRAGVRDSGPCNALASAPAGAWGDGLGLADAYGARAGVPVRP